MSKHTKGPWNWMSEIDENGKLTGKQIVYDNEDYRDIAHLPHGRDKKEVRANAQLIAASPYLLEACELALSSCNPHDSAHRRIQAAIDKAKGRGE